MIHVQYNYIVIVLYIFHGYIVKRHFTLDYTLKND